MRVSVNTVLSKLQLRAAQTFILHRVSFSYRDAEDVKHVIRTVGILTDWEDDMPSMASIAYVDAGGNVLISDQTTGIIWGFGLSKRKKLLKVIKKTKFVAVVCDDGPDENGETDFTVIEVKSVGKMLQGIAVRN